MFGNTFLASIEQTKTPEKGASYFVELKHDWQSPKTTIVDLRQ